MEQHSALVQLVHAVTTLDGVAAVERPGGVQVGADPGLALVRWSAVDAALGADDPFDRAPRLRLALLLALHRLVAERGAGAAGRLRRAARPLALPARHALHPGPGWALGQVPGRVLEVGTGVVGLLPGLDLAVPLPPSVADVAGLDVPADWPRLQELGETGGELATERWARSGGATGESAVLEGAGGCDALTLLALPGVRSRLASALGAAPALGGPPTPRALVAAPSRLRVWTGRAAADVDWARAVRTLTVPAERGAPGPLMMDADHVAAAPPAQRSGTSPTGR